MARMTVPEYNETIVANGSNDLDSTDQSGAGGAPLAPTSFAVAYIDGISQGLTWVDNATNELNYELGRSLTGTGGWTALADPAANATAATSTGLTVDTQYFYRLRAVNASGNSSYATANGTTTAATGPTSTPNLFSDGFEDGTMEVNSVRTVPLNTISFTWLNLLRTSLVTGDGANNTQIYPTVVGPLADGRDWTAKTGDNSMRFRYQANEPDTEQRYDHSAHSEIWVRYWTRVPTNYTHGVGSGAPTNNKFFAMWNDTYSQGGLGSTIWWGLEQAASGGGNSKVWFTHTLGGNTASLGNQGEVEDFIVVSRDQGRWMQCVTHVKNETSLGAADGFMKAYRRWEDESTFTQLYDGTGLALREEVGFRRGYLHGWANGKYTVDTEWLVDDFEVSTGSLIT